MSDEKSMVAPLEALPEPPAVALDCAAPAKFIEVALSCEPCWARAFDEVAKTLAESNHVPKPVSAAASEDAAAVASTARTAVEYTNPALAVETDANATAAEAAIRV
jgi:hypothetical protein